MFYFCRPRRQHLSTARPRPGLLRNSSDLPLFTRGPGAVALRRVGSKMGDEEGVSRSDPRVEYISTRVQATFPKMVVRAGL